MIRLLLPRQLGPLESRALETLWSQPGASTVRDLLPKFSAVAYTTLMTTLDRLYRKGVLLREKRGRAFAYRPALTRAAFESARAADALRAAMAGRTESLTPLMSFFVQAVSERDRELLDELEALVRSRRAEIEGT